MSSIPIQRQMTPFASSLGFPLYDLALELRQDIFRWILLIHHEGHSLRLNKNTNNPTIVFKWLVEGDGGWEDRNAAHDITQELCYFSPLRRIPYWGTKRMSILMPISRQWYKEIQQVLYASFDFEICIDLINRMPPAVFCLSFLPIHSFQLIRKITLYVSRTLVEEHHEIEFMEHSFKEIAKTLSGLHTVTLWMTDKIWIRQPPITRDIDQEFFDEVIAMASLFKHVPRVKLLPLRSYDDPELTCFDSTVLKCHEAWSQIRCGLEN